MGRGLLCVAHFHEKQYDRIFSRCPRRICSRLLCPTKISTFTSLNLLSWRSSPLIFINSYFLLTYVDSYFLFIFLNCYFIISINWLVFNLTILIIPWVNLFLRQLRLLVNMFIEDRIYHFSNKIILFNSLLFDDLIWYGIWLCFLLTFCIILQDSDQ